jgi:Fic family protein
MRCAFPAYCAEIRVGHAEISKWALIEKCSPDTVLRDIQELLYLGILAKDKAGGRSTSYSLARG